MHEWDEVPLANKLPTRNELALAIVTANKARATVAGLVVVASVPLCALKPRHRGSTRRADYRLLSSRLPSGTP